jgi:hypothetical protein
MRCISCVQFMVLALCCPAASRDGGFKAPLNLTVRTYNYAEVPIETLANAERRAADVLRRVRIELVWIDCPISRNEAKNISTCSDLTGFSLVLKILPQVMAARFNPPLRRLGMTIQGHGSFIFYQRLRDLAKNTGLSEAAMLGSVMAHEFGHLLLVSRPINK